LGYAGPALARKDQTDLARACGPLRAVMTAKGLVA